MGGALKAIAVSGDVLGSGPIVQFNRILRLNRRGEVVFVANTMTPEFVSNQETLRKDPIRIFASGDPAPGTGGGTFDLFNICFMDDDANIPFSAGVQGGNASEGIFVSNEDGSQIQKVVLRFRRKIVAHRHTEPIRQDIGESKDNRDSRG